MKFQHSIIINKPQEEVAAYFADPSYLSLHQDGFLRKEFDTGEPGTDGATARMYYKQGNGEMEITETIVANNLPDSFEAFYHHKHMDNTFLVTFRALDDNTTEYTTVGEYVKVRGFMPKMMMFLFPSMFKNQPLKWIKNFKAFVEAQ